MVEEKKELGLIPKLIKNYKWRRGFTKEELKEIDKIKRSAYLEEIRKNARVEGINKAKEDMEDK